MSQPLLEVKNLVRHYERPPKRLFGKKHMVEALNGVSFDIEKGESFGIVGESGSGKSTLARAILALEQPTSGSVLFKGENLFDISADKKLAARRDIQMVFQDPFGSLDPKHKVRSIVTEPLALIEDMNADERDAKAADALTDVGLDPGDLDKYPHEFSGGQRQRIAIARALITRPELIVADEPVSALDVSVQAQVLNLMMDLQSRFGLTYIIISHDLSVVRHVTDRLAVMQAGLIVERGQTGEVFESPKRAYTQMLMASVLDIPADALPADAKDKSADDKVIAETDDTKGAADDDAVADLPVVEVDAGAAIRAADSAIAHAIATVREQDLDLTAEPEDAEQTEDSETEAPLQTVEATADASVEAEEQAAPPPPVETGDNPWVVRETKVQPAEPGPEPVMVASIISASPPSAPETPENEDQPADDEPSDTATAPQPAIVQGLNLIDGCWQDASDGRMLKVVNPSDGGSFGYIARGTAADVDRAVAVARRALDGPWGRLPAFERGRVLAALSRLVLENADHLARLEARDVGKPLRQARADATALARYFEYYGGAADKVHGETIPYQEGYTVLTLREPHGVTGHIVPWNYPMQIIGRSVGAALAMGNTCVLKPGEDASLTALEIGQMALDAGLPPGVLNIVTGLGEEAGAALADHPGVDHLSFTGSPATGKRVQEAAAAHSCPVTLELGGKSPQIVFADADLEQALPFLVNAAIQNAGQTCSAGSRVLIQDWIYDELTHRLAERFAKLKAGPAQRDLDCGPVISPVQKGRIDGYLTRANGDGIAVLAEGSLAEEAPEDGYYVKPTLFGNVPTDHALAQEEVFGPVLAAMRFSNEEEAIRIANDSAYGLVAGIWTRDGARQMRLARAIRTGQVFINNYGAGGGVELPFGGVKRSGFGREKGFEALYGFSTLKTIAIRH